MAWIIGRKPIAPATEGTIVDFFRRDPDFTLGKLQSIIPTNYGGVSGDYSYYYFTGDEYDKMIQSHQGSLTA